MALKEREENREKETIKRVNQTKVICLTGFHFYCRFGIVTVVPLNHRDVAMYNSVCSLWKSHRISINLNNIFLYLGNLFTLVHLIHTFKLGFEYLIYD